MFTRIMATALVLGGSALLFAAQSESDDSSQQPPEEQRLEKLVGKYQIIEAAKNGAVVPTERLSNNTVVFTRETIAVVDPDRKELYSARFKLGPRNNEGVAQINMRSEAPQSGTNAVGLLKHEGEQVWLIYALDGRRPKDFGKTIEGQHLFKMKRKPAKQAEDEPT